MTTGTIKWFMEEPGFGFIISDDGARELFADASAFVDPDASIRAAGQRVEFDEQRFAVGPQAMNVRAIRRG